MTLRETLQTMVDGGYLDSITMYKILTEVKKIVEEIIGEDDECNHIATFKIACYDCHKNQLRAKQRAKLDEILSKL